ncbi:hypothetical protein TNCV_1149411 [Trichonephila clavipes]|nr:hypothetical protein TNCV_1149411 [Trichonephila clavipes]
MVDLTDSTKLVPHHLSIEVKTYDKSGRLLVSCYGYGCGKLSVTKPRCPNCKPIATQQILATLLCIQALQLRIKLQC